MSGFRERDTSMGKQYNQYNWIGMVNISRIRVSQVMITEAQEHVVINSHYLTNYNLIRDLRECVITTEATQ